jgi:uracil-DNA glycosylase
MPPIAIRSNAAILPEGWDATWDWTRELAAEFGRPYFRRLSAYLERQRRGHTIYPDPALTFEAFRRTPLASVRVVILGQDPYHGAGQAHGLSFSVPREQRIPRSLKNIFRELCADLDAPAPIHGNLERWSAQGVLLLNTVLTVRAAAANSHRGQGWEVFTDAVIRCVSVTRPYCAFILWGRPAIAKSNLIGARHAQFCSAHPSPLSARRGFFGSRVFSRCNHALRANGQDPISW